MAFTFAMNQPTAATNAYGDDGSVLLATWSGGAATDQGVGLGFVQWADACVQATGTIGTSTLTIEGSNDGTNWATLNSAQGTALSFTSLVGLVKQIVERPLYIRPALSAGTASGIVVTIVARRANPLRT